MISYYKTSANAKIVGIDNYIDGCWVKCVAPNEEEIDYLISKFNLEPDFLKSSLDEEESSHIDYEEGTTLIVLDSPIVNKTEENFTYYTVPLSIMVTPVAVITVSLSENSIIEEFSEGLLRNVRTDLQSNFVLHIMLRMTSKYLQYLKQIDKITGHVEKELRKSMKNKELIQLLEIEKSLVYFSFSLKANNNTFQKLTRRNHMNLLEDDKNLLEDALIEIKQAIEMSEIYLNILSGTMDAYASIISNNLNIVMKVLASITLIISIPTVISGIYGMNNPDIPMMDYWWFPIVLSLILALISWYFLRKKDMI
ncbi:MAG: magnesium transporter CorA family protein [Candidatus Paraimprobicoccus trichonymphae]|uniref:Magnesium transporter CorA family protein n=1 Tax=Candidatus Paraimprobicoccus trichonymphae TaxID=3033793 RepID=A0AA48IA35_9FIRM|nr:MAG: magnesium transporter CorA family protein [Candidatus Paraimprobicoccus trichonymphae]